MSVRWGPRLSFAAALVFALFVMIPARPEGTDNLAARATWDTFLGMGDELAGEGQVESALSTYREALKFASTDRERAITHLRIGQGLLVQGLVIEAVAQLEIARTLAVAAGEADVPREDILASLEEAYRANGDAEKADAVATELAALARGAAQQ